MTGWVLLAYAKHQNEVPSLSKLQPSRNCFDVMHCTSTTTMTPWNSYLMFSRFAAYRWPLVYCHASWSCFHSFANLRGSSNEGLLLSFCLSCGLENLAALYFCQMLLHDLFTPAVELLEVPRYQFHSAMFIQNLKNLNSVYMMSKSENVAFTLTCYL